MDQPVTAEIVYPKFKTAHFSLDFGATISRPYFAAYFAAKGVPQLLAEIVWDSIVSETAHDAITHREFAEWQRQKCNTLTMGEYVAEYTQQITPSLAESEERPPSVDLVDASESNQLRPLRASPAASEGDEEDIDVAPAVNRGPLAPAPDTTEALAFGPPPGRHFLDRHRLNEMAIITAIISNRVQIDRQCNDFKIWNISR